MRRNEKGRGVYADKAFLRGERIEVAPVLVLPRDQIPAASLLLDYVFEWTANTYALALGTGSLYNHSFEPNAYYLMDVPKQAIAFFALLPIGEGEEVLVNYNGDPHDHGELHFKVHV